jgi:hypothetical protein
MERKNEALEKEFVSIETDTRYETYHNESAKEKFAQRKRNDARIAIELAASFCVQHIKSTKEDSGIVEQK